MRFLISLAIGLSLPVAATAQSFNCAKATSPAEKAICADRGLGQLDERLSAAYATRLKSLDAAGQRGLKAEQRAWMKVRTICSGNPGCLKPLMADRITALKAPVRSTSMRPVGTWCSGDGQAGLSLMPKGGALALSYAAFGGNGHSCGLDATLRKHGDSWSGTPGGCAITVTGMNGNVMMQVDTFSDACRQYCGARMVISSQQWTAKQLQPGAPRAITMESGGPCF